MKPLTEVEYAAMRSACWAGVAKDSGNRILAERMVALANDLALRAAEEASPPAPVDDDDDAPADLLAPHDEEVEA